MFSLEKWILVHAFYGMNCKPGGNVTRYGKAGDWNPLTLAGCKVSDYKWRHWSISATSTRCHHIYWNQYTGRIRGAFRYLLIMLTRTSPSHLSQISRSRNVMAVGALNLSRVKRIQEWKVLSETINWRNKTKRGGMACTNDRIKKRWRENGISVVEIKD